MPLSPWTAHHIKQCEQQVGLAILNDEQSLGSVSVDFGGLTHAEPAAARRSLNVRRPKFDRVPLQDLIVDRRLDARPVVAAERLHPPGAVAHAKRGGVDVEHDARLRRILGDRERRLPGADVDQEVVSGLRRGAGAPGPHRQGSVVGPELVRAYRECHAR